MLIILVIFGPDNGKRIVPRIGSGGLDIHGHAVIGHHITQGTCMGSCFAQFSRYRYSVVLVILVVIWCGYWRFGVLSGFPVQWSFIMQICL